MALRLVGGGFVWWHRVYLTLTLLLALVSQMVVAQQSTVSGVVLDSLSGLPISYASVYIKGTTRGAMTLDDGCFEISQVEPDMVLGVSVLGYEGKELRGSELTVGDTVTFALLPISYHLAEIEVTPRKEVYQEENNPAIDLARWLIAHRDDHSIWRHSQSRVTCYRNLLLALNRFETERIKGWWQRKFGFVRDYVEVSPVTGESILPLSVEEQLSIIYRRSHPDMERVEVLAQRSEGVAQGVTDEQVKPFLKEALREVDIFQDYVPLFLNRFVSPLSQHALSFYKYYLLDTLSVEGVSSVQLAFVPRVSESRGFTGSLYVTADSTHRVQRVVLNIPHKINLNFVDQIYITQLYGVAADGTRLKESEDMVVEFALTAKEQGLYAREQSHYTDYAFELDSAALWLFEQEQTTVLRESVAQPPNGDWESHRPPTVEVQEGMMSHFLAQMRQVPLYYYTERLVTILVEGYVPLSKKNSKFDFGPMNTTLSSNTVEGLRMRVGGITTSNLSRRVYGSGYLAYGTRDNRFKYSAQLSLLLGSDGADYLQQFPVHALSLSYGYDIDQLGQHYLYTNKDNIFLSLKRESDPYATYLRKFELRYTRESYTHFTTQLAVNHQLHYSSPYLPFVTGHGEVIDRYPMSLAEVQLRYAPNEKFQQSRTQRIPITLDSPIFTLQHQMGWRNLGSRYNYQRTELGVQQRIWCAPYGYIDGVLRAGRVWTKVPFTELFVPNANLSYTIQPESYALMSALEFVNDTYASAGVEYHLNGWLLNRVPLLKRLQLRSLVTFRALYGSLSSRNHPEISNDLFQLPPPTYLMTSTPYMEAGIGIENIFKVARLDYVWRLSYRNHPNTDRSGLRFSLNFQF